MFHKIITTTINIMNDNNSSMSYLSPTIRILYPWQLTIWLEVRGLEKNFVTCKGIFLICFVDIRFPAPLLAAYDVQ